MLPDPTVIYQPPLTDSFPGHYPHIHDAMPGELLLWNQNGQLWDEHPESDPGYFIPASQWQAHVNAASTSYATPHTTGQQPQPMNYDIHSQNPQNFDTPQVQSSAGPSRVPRRQNAQEKVIQADPTRKSTASRNERSQKKRVVSFEFLPSYFTSVTDF